MQPLEELNAEENSADNNRLKFLVPGRGHVNIELPQNLLDSQTNKHTNISIVLGKFYVLILRGQGFSVLLRQLSWAI